MGFCYAIITKNCVSKYRENQFSKRNKCTKIIKGILFLND